MAWGPCGAIAGQWWRTDPSWNFRLLQAEDTDRANGVSAAQVRPDLLVKTLPGIAGCHRNPDLPNGNPDLSADLQQLRPDGGDLRLCQFRSLQPHTAQTADQDICRGRQI